MHVDRPAHAARQTRAWGWLISGAALVLLSNGRWVLPAAAWWAPVFLLRFLRSQRAAVALPVGVVVSCLVMMLGWRGMLPVPGALYFLIASMIGVVYFLPYAIDRLVAPRLGGFAATLVLPLAWASVEYLDAVAAPYGTWGSAAYAHVDNLPLLQLVSVTGLWGVSFLVAWFASVVNWAWESAFAWPRIRAGALAYVALLSTVLLLGAARLVFFPPKSETVRIATFTVTGAEDDPIWAARDRIPRQAELDSMRVSTWARLDSLLARTAREARAGAQIVSWSEADALVLEQDEATFIARAAEVARRENIYLLMALGSITPGQRRWEDHVVALAPDGSVAFRYDKFNRLRATRGVSGSGGGPPVLPTPRGRLGAAICQDMDFHRLVSVVGRERADFMVAPSSNWKEIDPIHTRMALVRGVENGCSVVRPTYQGLSAAGDYQGRILAAVDYFRSPDRTLVADVPSRGVVTVYARIGDLFAWLCLVALALLVAKALLRPTP